MAWLPMRCCAWRAPARRRSGEPCSRPVELFEQAAARFVELLRGGGDVDGEVAGGQAFDVHGVDGVGQAAAVAQVEEEPAALAGEELGDHLEAEAVVVVAR